MNNFNLGTILMGLFFATVKEYRDEVFAEQGHHPIKPSKTLQSLRHLSDAYSKHGASFKEEKEEIDNLIAISAEITEEKCNQEYMNRMNDMQIKYVQHQLNLIPYLLYNKKKLITDCANKFNVKDLNPQVTLYEVNHSSGLKTFETLEENAAREAEEDKQRQYLNEHPEIILEEKSVEQAKIDEEWMQKYEKVLFDRETSKDIQEMTETFYSLYDKRTKTSESDKIKTLSGNIYELIGLNAKFSTCMDEEFKVYEKLIEKYSQGFSGSIVEYINHYKLKFWQRCKNSFLYGQEPGNGHNLDFDDQVEAFSLVDHVLACHRLQPWQIKDLQSIKAGVIDYVHDKLGKKSYKKEKIDELFESKIRPTCSSVFKRFRTVDKIGEVVASRREFLNDLDEMDTKWLAAIAICEVLIENGGQLQDRVFSALYERREEAKKNTCFGKLFHKNH